MCVCVCVGGSSQRGRKPWFGLSISRSQGFYLALAAWRFVLSLGPTLRAFGRPTGITLPYMVVYRFCPGFDSIRSLSRLYVLVSIAVAVLAGEGVARIVDGVVLGGANRRSRTALTAMIVLMVMAEYASFPVRLQPIEVGSRVPEVYRWLATPEGQHGGDRVARGTRLGERFPLRVFLGVSLAADCQW